MTKPILRCALLATALTGSAQVHAQVYKDPDASIEERAEDLVDRMTLEEKSRQMQNSAPAIPRLDLPAYDWWNEGLHGLARAGEATVFPQSIGMAATWNTDLLYDEGRVIGTEARARYNQAQREGNVDRYFGLTIWSPNINIFRDPRWGRGQETLGEDPYLTGELATAFIRGLQGEDPTYRLTVATPKHFAVHSGPEPLRHEFNVDVDPQDLSETYFPAFRQTIIEGDADSIMCAYNAVDGVPACGSKFLLQEVLRDAWGFDGFVTSDCGAIEDFVSGHRTHPDHAAASAASVIAGTDTGCNFVNEYWALPNAVAQGLIDEATIDAAMRRLMEARLRLGMLDPAERVPYASIPMSENHSAANQKVALQAARQSLVMLQNDGTLPIATDQAPRLLVVGPAAVSREALNGNYKGTPVGQALPLDGIVEQFGAENVSFAQGAPFVEEIGLTVPRTVFGPEGLKVRFWNGNGFAGPVVATATQVEIDNDWNGVAPAPGVNREAFSVEYTGTITVPADGEYVFAIGDRKCDFSDDHQSYILSIEGLPTQRAWASCGQGVPLSTEPVFMRADEPRDFSLAFTHRSPRLGAGLTLTWRPPAEALLAEARAAAEDADVVVALVGLTAVLEGEEMRVEAEGFVGGDRTSIALPKVQRDLLDAMAESGKPLIVVGLTGSAIAYGDTRDEASAILHAWYGGEAGGTAIGEALAGAFNPSGRLPVTFYAGLNDLPPFDDYAMDGRTYRYYEGVPEFAFGHGLSYTKYGYGELTLPARVNAGESLEVSVNVSNEGAMAGEEVVQLYLEPVGQPGLPLRSLKGFSRVALAPGESRSVSITLNPRDLAFADTEGTMRVRSGQYRIWIGGGQEGTGAPGLAGSFAITGDAVMPR